VICAVAHAFRLLADLIDPLDQPSDFLPGWWLSFIHSITYSAILTPRQLNQH